MGFMREEVVYVLMGVVGLLGLVMLVALALVF